MLVNNCVSTSRARRSSPYAPEEGFLPVQEEYCLLAQEDQTLSVRAEESILVQKKNCSSRTPMVGRGRETGGFGKNN